MLKKESGIGCALLTSRMSASENKPRASVEDAQEDEMFKKIVLGMSMIFTACESMEHAKLSQRDASVIDAGTPDVGSYDAGEGSWSWIDRGFSKEIVRVGTCSTYDSYVIVCDPRRIGHSVINASGEVGYPTVLVERDAERLQSLNSLLLQGGRHMVIVAGSDCTDVREIEQTVITWECQ